MWWWGINVCTDKQAADNFSVNLLSRYIGIYFVQAEIHMGKVFFFFSNLLHFISTCGSVHQCQLRWTFVCGSLEPKNYELKKIFLSIVCPNMYNA